MFTLNSGCIDSISLCKCEIETRSLNNAAFLFTLVIVSLLALFKIYFWNNSVMCLRSFEDLELKINSVISWHKSSLFCNEFVTCWTTNECFCPRSFNSSLSRSCFSFTIDKLRKSLVYKCLQISLEFDWSILLLWNIFSILFKNSWNFWVCW